MTFPAEIGALKSRLAAAEFRRDTWKAERSQEHYLEACSLVDALTLQLGQLEHAARNDALIGADRLPDPAPPSAGERERLMAELAITFNGRHYQYGRYRYRRLDDAVRYARLQRAQPAGGDSLGAAPAPRAAEEQTEAQRRLMNAFSITFADGVYRLGDYRYEFLADALDYANLELRA